VPGYPDFFGTPLVNGVKFAAGPGATLAVPANTTKTVSMLVSHPGYFINISATIANAGATVPWYLVEFVWQDSGGATVIDVEHFYLPAASSGLWLTCGKGPNRGQLLTVNITNYDPAFAMTVTYSIGETTQHIARDDWRTVNYNTAVIPGYGGYSQTPNGVALGDMAAGCLATQNNDTLPAHTTWTQLLPLYTGLVFWQFNANAAITVSVRIPTALGNTPNLDSDSPIWFDSALTDVTVQLAHPRFPYYLDFSNTSASGIPFGWLGVMIENAS
jgi:hypothetical protein